MRFIQKIITPAQHYTPLVNNEPTDPGAWKARLVKQLPPHDASPFNQLIRDYLIEDRKPEDLSSLVCGCMKHGNVDVLTYILAHEDIKSLRIEGPINERGWKTLVKAMPGSLAVTELTLLETALNARKCEQMFKALKLMPALEKFSLKGVRVEGGLRFNRLICSDFPSLVKLEFTIYIGSDFDDLACKLLNACQVEHLSIEESETFSTAQHSRIAEKIGQQTRLNSLRLKIEHRDTPEQFECYMPLLCGKTKTPLVSLDLSRCFIGAHNFNQMINALLQNQPALESLILSKCGVAGDPKYKETVSINPLPLAEMKSLRHLDFSRNDLPKFKTVALLAALEKNQTALITLNLSGNWIGLQNILATAALLWQNNTLLRFSFEPPVMQTKLGETDEALERLALAVQHNKSLVELKFGWTPELADYRTRVDDCLYRNRYAPQRAFMEVAIQNAAAVAMPLLAGDLQYPQDMIQHIIGQGLTEHDALTLSSLNSETRAAHEELLRKTGS